MALKIQEEMMELQRQRDAAAAQVAAAQAAAAQAAAAARAAFEANEAERQRLMNQMRMQQEVKEVRKCKKILIKKKLFFFF